MLATISFLTFLVSMVSQRTPAGTYAVYVDPLSNRTHITIGFVWAKYYYSSLLNANASTTLPAMLYALNTIDTIMPGRFNFTCAPTSYLRVQ